MLCEFWGLGVWSIEVNKAAAGCGVLKAPAFKHMQGHPKLQGVTHMHISKRIRATWQKCFWGHSYVLISKVRNQTLISEILNVRTIRICILSIFHMGPKSSHALHIVWLHMLLSAFFWCVCGIRSDCVFPPQKCELLQIQENKKLVINTTSPPPPLHFIKSLLYYTL